MVSLLPVSEYSFTLSPLMCTQTYLDLFFLGLADCTCLISSTCLMNWVSTELPCTPGQDLSLSCSTSVTLCITSCSPSLEVSMPGLSLSSTLLVVVLRWVLVLVLALQSWDLAKWPSVLQILHFLPSAGHLPSPCS